MATKQKKRRKFKRWDLVNHKGRACLVTADEFPDRGVTVGGLLHESAGISVIGARELTLLKPSHKVKDLLDITPRMAGRLK